MLHGWYLTTDCCLIPCVFIVLFMGVLSINSFDLHVVPGSCDTNHLTFHHKLLGQGKTDQGLFCNTVPSKTDAVVSFVNLTQPIVI